MIESRVGRRVGLDIVYNAECANDNVSRVFFRGGWAGGSPVLTTLNSSVY